MVRNEVFFDFQFQNKRTEIEAQTLLVWYRCWKEIDEDVILYFECFITFFFFYIIIDPSFLFSSNQFVRL